MNHLRGVSSLLLCCSSLIAAEPPAIPHFDLTQYADSSGKILPVKTLDDWEHRRQSILKNMQTVMGPLPKPAKRVPLSMESLEETKLEGLTRFKIRYHTDSTEAWVHAYLLVPDELVMNDKLPAVLCLHQTTNIGKGEPAGLGGNPNLHYALHLAKRGFVTLAPDYPSFGDYQYDFAADDYVSGTMKAIYDIIRAVDLLQSLRYVDGERIGCIGHSLGGHNTMFTAAFEPRIKVMVSNCGFTRFHKYYEGKLQGWTSDRYMPIIRTTYENNPDLVPFDFPEIIGLFAPRPFLAVAPVRDSNFEVSGVKDSIASAEFVYGLYDAKDKLAATYPECEHDFPEDAREIAYTFLEKHLSATKSLGEQ